MGNQPEGVEDGVFDPFTPVPDPYTPLQEAHARCPVFPAANGTYVVTGASNVAEVFRDADGFRNELRPPKPGVEPSLVHLDGSDHSRLRKLVVKAFTPRAVKRLENPIHDIAHELIDAFIERGNADLCEEFGFLLPAMVIAELVGIPPGDRSMFVEWADDAIGASTPGSSGYAASDGELRDYVLRIIEERRASPGEDLLSHLIAVHEGEDHLSAGELAALVRQLILAGTDTTANLIGSMLHFLLSDPRNWERMRSDRALIPNVVEETLRCDPPLYWVPRKTARAIDVGGVTVPEDVMVCVAVGQSNRDASLVDRPNDWDMDRPAARNRTHMTFGYGEHFCIGSALARLEAIVALEVLLERIPDLRLADDYGYRPHGPLMMRGVASMPVTFPVGSRSVGSVAAQ